MTKNTSSNPNSIIGLNLQELKTIVSNYGGKEFRANQIFRWLYFSGVKSFSQMTNVDKSLIANLSNDYIIDRPEIVTEQKSSDGTIKWLLRLRDGNEIETVFIPESSRGTLCISSQVGCTLTCSFCHTGTQRMVRNLEAGEIVGQLMLARDRLNQWPSHQEPRLITNVVMMGMGEPLLNYENVIKAIKLLINNDGIGLSKRRVTLSTSGIVPNIVKCGEETGVNLAISLHATNDELRNILVPINKKYPLSELIEACRNYPRNGEHRRITFEYVMLKDINDSNDDAEKLVQLVEGIPAKVNLIPFNPWPGTKYQCSDVERISQFSKIIYKAGIEAPVRTPRGQDILAACGQLKSESIKQRKHS